MYKLCLLYTHCISNTCSSYLSPCAISYVKQNGLDCSVGQVLGGGVCYNLSVPREERVNLFEQLVEVDGGEELRYLTSDLP